MPKSDKNAMVEQPRTAIDGTQRGLSKTPKRQVQLMRACQKEVEAITGMKNWDPVVMLAVISARAFEGHPAVDENGIAILDEETGNPVMVPPDPVLASAVAAKAAPYLHATIRSKDPEPEDNDTDPEELKQRVLTAFENMGVKVNRGEKK